MFVKSLTDFHSVTKKERKKEMGKTQIVEEMFDFFNKYIS